MSILLERGQRGVLIGQTGSGKTWGGIFQLQRSPAPLVIVLDTKGEPAFNTLPLPGESHGFYNSGDDFLSELKSKNLPNYMIMRPEPAEMADPLELDNLLQSIYARGKDCLVYVDEAYQWHVNGRAGAGLTGLLTRGRSKGISVLLATQRPAWISRFCFTEAQKFYIYRVTDRRDIKTIGEHIPAFNIKDLAPKYNFWYYDSAADMESAVLYAPVPKPIKDETVTDSGKRWF